MAETAGTLEQLALGLTRALTPLGEALAAGEVADFFSELGLTPPDALLVDPAVASALQAAVDAAAPLPDRSRDLADAIRDEDLDAILLESTLTIAAIAQLLLALVALADALEAQAAAAPGGVDPAALAAFAQELARRLLDYTVVHYLEGYHPVALSTLALLGVVDYRALNAGSVDPARRPVTARELRLDRIPNLLRDPTAVLADTYRWGAADLRGEHLLRRIHDLVRSLGLAAGFDERADGGPALRLLGLRIGIADQAPAPGLALSLALEVPAGYSRRFPFVVPGWAVELSAEGTLQAGLESRLLPPAELVVTPPAGSVEGSVRARIFALPQPGREAIVLLGAPGGSRLQAAMGMIGAGAAVEWSVADGAARGEPLVEAGVFGGKVVIGIEGADGFLAQLLSGLRLQADFDLRVEWSPGRGARFEGSSALEVEIPLNFSLGPIELPRLYLRVALDPAEAAIPIEVSTVLRTSLGPLRAVIDRMGIEVRLTFPPSGGALGPLDFELGFRPPTGVGLSLDGGGFSGGGFLSFDREQERYAGILQLSFQNTFALAAIGLLTTRFPGGERGFSLLIIISAQFSGIQLGYGFTLNGVGGLLGLNRTMVLEALRRGVKDNTLDDILFPTDPVAHADRLISDLQAIFPPVRGQFVFGPMALIGWGAPTLITLELGLLIEVPDPVRIAILGVLRVVLPDEEASILAIQVNFLGTIDFERGELAFDASLFDSRLLVYTLSGDMAARLRWRGEPGFLVTVGGFHPAYDASRHQLPALTRMTLALLEGDNPRLRLEAYQAVTSNTVQFGARLELYVEVSGFNVYGWLGFDVLFQFNPFAFLAQVTAGLAVRRGDDVLLAVDVTLTLRGPSPWNAEGTARFKILFFTIRVHFNKTFGDRRDTSLPDVEVLPRLLEAFSRSGNWESSPPAHSAQRVTLREIQVPPDAVVVHPFGTLLIREKVVPLGVTIQRFGNARPTDGDRFDIERVEAAGERLDAGEVRDEFAPAQFFELSDAEKLSRRSFETLRSGVTVRASERLAGGRPVTRRLEYEVTIVDNALRRRREELLGAKMDDFSIEARGSAAARSDAARANRTPLSVLGASQVEVGHEGYTVVRVRDLTPVSGDAAGITQTEALDRVRALVAQDRSLEGALMVVPSWEASAA